MASAIKGTQDPLRIVYLVCDYASVNSGGIATYIHSIATSLSQDGHKIEVLSPKLPNFPPTNLPYKMTQLITNGRLTNRLELSEAFAHAVAFHVENIDLIEATDWGMEGFHCTKRSLRPCVIRFHTPNSKVEQLNGEIRRQDSADVNAAEAEYFTSTPFLSAPSRSMVDTAVSTWPRISSVEHVPNPILTRSQPTARATSGYRRYGFVGRLEVRKGVYELAEALAIFLAECPDAQFLFAGPDTRTAKSSVGKDLRAILAGVRDRVHFYGFLDEERKLEFLSTIDCAVLPSRWENAPYACVDAMAAGLPLIVTSGSGFEELIGSSENAVLVPPNDVAGLLDALRLRHQATSQPILYQSLCRLNWNSLRKPTLDFYRRVVNS